MKPTHDPLPALLGCSTRSELRYRLAAEKADLDFLQVQRLGRHLAAMDEASTPIRIGVVHSYTSDLLNPWLQFEAQLQGLRAEIRHAPYGFLEQAAQPGSELVAQAPDMLLLLLQWEDLHPALARPLSGMDEASRGRVARESCDRLTSLLALLRERVTGQLVVTLLPSPYSPGLGEYDSQSAASEGAWRAQVKAMLAAFLRDSLPGATLLDLDESVAELGRQRFFDLRLWYSSRFPFAPPAAREVARRAMAIGAVLKLPRAKAIVLDADNTLWGGIIGEDGMAGIALGPDYPGNAFVAFQRRLLEFQQRGFVLALCSKNNPDDLLEVLREHPHQLLREEHFAALRVNWNPKPENLRSLAEELNLGLESFVYVDDSDHECLAVRSELPQIEVVKTPGRATDIPACLDRVARLQVLRLTDEDRQKTELYVQERRRREFSAATSDLASYLASLEMRMRVRYNDATALGRLAQLTQKTNQFNLTTRRYTESEIQAFIAGGEWLVAHFSLADIFGDSGIVGLALVRLQADATAELDTFLMSCRVIGRAAESAFLDTILRTLQSRGYGLVHAHFIPTAKNKLAERFLPDHAFDAVEGNAYRRDLREAPPAGEGAYPIRIEIAEAAGSPARPASSRMPG